jgi:hypothetical protein
VELIRGVADEPETRLDLRNRRVMISTTVIAGPKLWQHGGDEAVAGPDYRLEPRRSAVAIRIALRHSTRFILAVLPSARGIPGLPVAQRLVLSPQSTRAGVRPIARMPIGVPTACSAAAPPAYVVILRVNRRTATILKRYDSARKRAIDSCKAQTNAGINGPSLSHEASKPP